MRVLVAREDLERISDVVSGALGGDGAVDDGPDGWAQLEPLLPGLETGHRPVIRIRNRKHPEAFSQVVASFNALWQRAEPLPAALVGDG